MADHSDAHGGHDHEEHGSMGKYLAVFVALLILTTLSFVVGMWIQDASGAGRFFGNALMMAISCVKAMLVMLFFMHLIWEANWKYVLTIPSLMMSVFLLCMLIPDVGLRSRAYSNSRIIHAPLPAVHAEDHGDDAHGDGDHHDQEVH